MVFITVLSSPSFSFNFEANKKHHKPCTYKKQKKKNVTFNVLHVQCIMCLVKIGQKFQEKAHIVITLLKKMIRIQNSGWWQIMLLQYLSDKVLPLLLFRLYMCIKNNQLWIHIYWQNSISGRTMCYFSCTLVCNNLSSFE